MIKPPLKLALLSAAICTVAGSSACAAGPRRLPAGGGIDHAKPLAAWITTDGILSKWNPQTHAMWLRPTASDRDLVLVTDSTLHVLRGVRPAKESDLAVGQRVQINYVHQGGVNRALLVKIEAPAFAASSWAEHDKSMSHSRRKTLPDA